jgi:hypothetical protein
MKPSAVDSIPSNPSVCFLVGAERSGTTMLRLMLDHHPEIAFHGEYEFMVDYLPDNGFPSMNDYAENLRTNRVFNHWKLEPNFKLTYPELMWSFLRQRLNKASYSVLGATIHHNFDRIVRIWPDAKFIHILRDPRDVALSVVQMGWAGNVWAGAKIWREAEETWSTLQKNLHDNQWIEVRFEQLVASPTTEISKICKFLDLDYDDSVFDYSTNSTYAPPDPKIANKWMRSYPRKGAEFVELALYPLLQERGYEPSSAKNKPIGLFTQLWLRFDNKLRKVKYSIRYYGLWLYLRSFLARKLHIHSLDERCRVARWAIDEGNLK